MEIKFITNDKNWLEHDAITQLEAIAKYEGIEFICAMPDLHPGRTPVGAVIVTKDIVYPHLIGNDIGCGMSLYKLDIERSKIKQDKLAKAAENMLQDSASLYGLGTIGSGNHFAEVQEVNEIIDADVAKEFAIDKKTAFLLVHSGSRDYGNKVFAKALETDGLINGYETGGKQFEIYMNMHDKAVKRAADNRDAIADRIAALNGLKCRFERLCESVHNSIEQVKWHEKIVFVHRKGASSAVENLVVIPGSRDSLTYLVKPLSLCESTFYTVAHGAGRKWNRTFCKSRLDGRYDLASTVTKKYKSKLIYRDKECVFQEAPECYKNIDIVVDSMVNAGLIKVVATFNPLLTVKG